MLDVQTSFQLVSHTATAIGSREPVLRRAYISGQVVVSRSISMRRSSWCQTRAVCQQQEVIPTLLMSTTGSSVNWTLLRQAAVCHCTLRYKRITLRTDTTCYFIHRHNIHLTGTTHCPSIILSDMVDWCVSDTT